MTTPSNLDTWQIEPKSPDSNSQAPIVGPKGLANEENKCSMAIRKARWSGFEMSEMKALMLIIMAPKPPGEQISNFYFLNGTHFDERTIFRNEIFKFESTIVTYSPKSYVRLC